MADESMVRNLDAQARAIWPQEVELFGATGSRAPAGFSTRAAAPARSRRGWRSCFRGARCSAWTSSTRIWRSRAAGTRGSALAPSLRAQTIFGLQRGRRHVRSDGVPARAARRSRIPERVLAELVRVTRPGGRLHLIPEDYGMLHFQRGRRSTRRRSGTSARRRSARRPTPTSTSAATRSRSFRLGLADITVDYVVVDTIRVPRETFASIIEAWRDGTPNRSRSIRDSRREEAVAYFDQMIGDIRNPRRYAALDGARGLGTRA